MNTATLVRARCFLPQEPTRYDKALELRKSTMDFTPALRYGELVICLPHNVSLFATHPVALALREKMRDFSQDDYLIAAGDPTLIGMAFHIALMKTGGKFNQLKWDRHTSQYLKLEINMDIG